MGANVPGAASTMASAAACAAVMQQQQQFAAGMPSLPHMNNKKQRELYVGGLPPGLSEPMIKELFAQMLQACEGYDSAMGQAVLNVQLCGGGTYAFVEFRDEVLCETCMLFTGMHLSGKQLKINHPNGYIVPAVPLKLLVPPPAMLAKFGLSPAGVSGGLSSLVVPPPDTKKSRELYVGNLTTGAVTGTMLKELFTAPLLTLPGVDAGGAPPVIDCRVDPQGRFAFVEFRDEMLATTALSLFHGMELCGRAMSVARPTGYVPSTEAAGLPGMPGVPGVPGVTAMPGAGISAVPPAPPAATTRVVRLDNLLTEDMITDDAEFKECFEDIRGECERFGSLTSFVIPRKQDLGGYMETDVGKCFVTYETVSSAVKAHAELDGRDFDGNKVKVTFLPES